MHVFVATDLTEGEHQREHTEQDMVVGRVPMARFEAMLRDGEIVDSMTHAAYGLYRLRETKIT